MKKKEFLSKSAFFAVVLAALVLAGQAFGQEAVKTEQNRMEPKNDAAPVAAAGWSSGLFSLLPGQSVRVAAVNGGNKAIPLQIYIIRVTEQGKVEGAIPCNATPAPGDAAFDKFAHPGGVNRMLMYVQIRVERAGDLKDLAPSLEIYDTETGAVAHFLSGGSFVELRPIYVPPFAPEIDQ